MEDAYIIHGGKRLEGFVQLSGAKNVALKVLIAALLFESKAILNNIPRLNDVIELINLINSLGAKAEFTGPDTVMIDPSGLSSSKLDLLFASKIRVSFMFFAPLLYKFHEAHIPNPGGCRIGARPIDRPVEGLKKFGIKVDYDSEDGYYHARMEDLPTGKYRFEKISVTSTELLIMMGIFTGDSVTIENAALEPEIDDLIQFLNISGAQIRRSGTSIIIQKGSKLIQKEPYTIMPDRIEAGTYAVLGLVTKGDVTISAIDESVMKKFHEKLLKANAGVEKLPDNRWRYFYKGPLKAVDINTQPHPGFMTDWQPIWAILMTQATGDSIIYERIFENRFAYVDELRKLGADVNYVKVPIINPADFFFFNFDPAKKYNQTIRIRGPQKLHNAAVEVNDLRAGAALAVAAIIAEGESIVNNASMLERGYEKFVEKVSGLGGDIRKV